ncbi:pseudouridine synthase [Armillaria fumosa]|nr:pseudouridine synthase [Armillaria fumosa]
MLVFGSLKIHRYRLYSTVTVGAMAPNYEAWSKTDLIARINALERREASNTTSAQSNADFDFYSYPIRKIALKFCYSGWEYNGLAYQKKPTPLPTVEGVLYDALCRARLIDEARGYDGCGWEKCGRTDRGVSAAGQVVSLWVRSALRQSKKNSEVPADKEAEELDTTDDDMLGLFDNTTNTSLSFRPEEEHDYPGILNRILPPTIRVLAWSPVSEKFSARRSCQFRHYKYFFSDSNLDLSLMREAASHLVGLHDFRNLCKIDASKQLTLFMRRILRAEINAVEAGMFVFDLVGTAFLYHQVRNIMAVLLLVGRGLEPPDIITQLLNVSKGAEPGSWEVLSRKPEYQMADGLPLVLWDCGYDEKDVQWQTGGAEGETRGGQARGIYEHLEGIYERSRVFTTLNHHFLKKAAELHSSRPVVTRQETPFHEKWNHSEGIEVPLGAGATRKIRQYVPLMRRVRNDEVEAINERWRNGKGKKYLAKMDNEDDDDDGEGDDDVDE